jgi:hypothetical protein
MEPGANASKPMGEVETTSTIRFSDGENFVEMVLTEEGDHPYGAGDAKFEIKVRSGGIVYSGDAWILLEDARAFCRALASLNRTLRGEALLKSASPGELELRLRPADDRGLMLVSASAGSAVYGQHSLERGRERLYWHGVNFHIEFEPAQLSAAMATPWVAKNAK